MKHQLGPMDAALLLMETKRAPLHIGCLAVFKHSEGNSEAQIKAILKMMREQPFIPSPFDCRVADSKLAKVRPRWKPVDLDMEYHVRHAALPRPGNERQLGELISKVHSLQLDLEKPLWEAHVIEGLEDNRFAIYFKAHHAAIDGMGGMALAKIFFKDSPGDMEAAIIPQQLPSRPEPKSVRKLATEALIGAKTTATGILDLSKGVLRMLKSENNMVKATMATPKSMFNVRITQQRRLSTLNIELARIKAVGKALGVTVNDVVLGIVAGGVREYLLEQNALPEKSLTASCPMGLDRPEGDGGNAASGFVTKLATDIVDPVARLKRINAATTQCKSDLGSMTREAQDSMALLGLGPMFIGGVSGQASRLPPLMNFVVSNVVLTPHKLYLMGCEMEAMVPVSFLFDGYALNVTLVGYGGNVAIGFVGCNDVIPHMQRLAIHTNQALEELESLVGKLAQ